MGAISKSVVLCLGLIAVSALGQSDRLLSSLIKGRPPWVHAEADSEQGFPLYLGTSPRDLRLGRPKKPKPEIPSSLKTRGEAQATGLMAELGQTDIELEGWPYPHWKGQLDWVFARWRPQGTRAWRWLDASQGKPNKGVSPPELPTVYRSWVAHEAHDLFTDFLHFDDLKKKPVFGRCVWTREDGSLLEGWLSSDRREAFHKNLHERRVCHAIHPVAWFNDSPMSFVLHVNSEGVQWPDVVWKASPNQLPAVVTKRYIETWPSEFDEQFRADLVQFTAETYARKNNAQPDNQLGQLVKNLEGWYRKLGVRTTRHTFRWRGIPQVNLIAEFPGSDRKSREPIILADHIDTAFCDDTFKKTGQRVSTAGADDNTTALATLLAAARILAKGPPTHRRPIWLMHTTAEEFPADSLGARRFLEKALQDKLRIAGLVQVDMIGWRNPGDKIFQIASGDSEESLEMAAIAMAVARDVAPQLDPKFRHRYDPESYLYNTDGIVYSHLGYPVILFNEHLNGKKLDNPHYHKSTDTAGNVDLPYATAIARVAIETTVRLADR